MTGAESGTGGTLEAVTWIRMVAVVGEGGFRTGFTQAFAFASLAPGALLPSTLGSNLSDSPFNPPSASRGTESVVWS